MFTRPVFARNVSRVLAAAAASAIVLSASAQAGEVKTVDVGNGRTVRSVEVKFVDLDLTSQKGRATLEGRLKSASRLVCGSATSRSLRETADHQACVDQTLASGQKAMVTLVARAEAGDRFKPGERIAVGS